ELKVGHGLPAGARGASDAPRIVPEQTSDSPRAGRGDEWPERRAPEWRQGEAARGRAGGGRGRPAGAARAGVGAANGSAAIVTALRRAALRRRCPVYGRDGYVEHTAGVGQSRRQRELRVCADLLGQLDAAEASAERRLRRVEAPGGAGRGEHELRLVEVLEVQVEAAVVRLPIHQHGERPAAGVDAAARRAAPERGDAAPVALDPAVGRNVESDVQALVVELLDGDGAAHRDAPLPGAEGDRGAA